MRRFGTTWTEALGTVALAGVVALLGSVFLSLIDASHGWYLTLGLVITAVALLKALLPGAGITIHVRIHPPDARR